MPVSVNQPPAVIAVLHALCAHPKSPIHLHSLHFLLYRAIIAIIIVIIISIIIINLRQS